jgi:hypothetical protein
MKINLNDFSRKARCTYYSDLVVINSKRDYLKQIYADKKYKRRGSIKSINGTEPIVNASEIKPLYLRSEGFSLPWTSERLYTQIAKNNRSSLPSVINLPTTSDVEASDVACIDRYSVRSRNARFSAFKFLSKCGLHAAQQIGILDLSCGKNRRYTTTSQAVIDTAKNTNSGFPLYQRKSDERCISDTKVWLNDFICKPTLYGIMRNPCVILHRFQPKLNEEKKILGGSARQVWCEPQRIIALEQYFFGSFIENSLENSSKVCDPVYISGLRNSRISSSALKPLRAALQTNFKSKTNRNVFSLDFSKYDSSLSDYMFDIFFGIIAEKFNFKSEEEAKAFDLLRIYSKYTPYIYKNEFRLQLRGIGSGSKLTNLFDTWYNVTLWNAAKDIESSGPECFNRLTGGEDFILMELPENLFVEYVSSVTCRNFSTLKVCGDDTAICCYSGLIEVHKRICNSMGMKISVRHIAYNPSDDIFFLGRFWDCNNEPFNSEFYISSHIIFRSNWYRQDRVDFEVTKDNIEFGRIFSICGALSNGSKYISKTFKTWNKLNRFFLKNSKFVDLTSWDNKNTRKELASVLNWRLF